ncbi:PPE family protein, SVP subgroup [Mycobacterium malmoense]|uniref:PPE family protein, SVP subgroup n=1 Tax=Mycobacterium malmoense TaxID=1780 RepID=UPI0009F177E1
MGASRFQRRLSDVRAHPGPRPGWPFHPRVGAPSAGMGGAPALGPLSVPAAWAASATGVDSAPPPLPDAGADAAGPGRTFRRALMATIIGRDAGRPPSATSVRRGR